MAVFFISNCRAVTSGRDRIVTELMASLPVHSYGKCHKNADENSVERCKDADHRQRKLCIISTYKFYLAFENSIDHSYVSEKYYQGLLSGSIPIYLGAPNIERFYPLEGQTPIIKVIPNFCV